MAITVRNLSDVFGKDVFTTRGVYCGRVSDLEINLQKFRIRSLLIEAAKGTFLANLVSGKKGIILPYQLVESVGDVVIIKHITAPAISEKEEQTEKEEPSSLTSF